MKKYFIFFTFFLFVGKLVWAFPALTGQVVDAANVLSSQTEQKLLETLKKHNLQHIVFVTVPSLEGKTIDEYGVDLGRYWQIGEKGKDNGILVIMAPKERYVRIEVGYGMEGIVTDYVSSMIIDKKMMPFLTQGDFNNASVAAMQGLLQVLQPQKKSITKQNTSNDWELGIILFIILILVSLYIFIGPREEMSQRVKNVFIFILLIVDVLSSAKGSKHSGGWRGSNRHSGSRGRRYKSGGGSFGGGGSSRRF